ncbi:MAG: hypothetical protein FXF47_07625 [Candidatus Mcinerneyibacterium aminivorans]|jgi:hypothetical protein|uniref:Uncharacterized protein n=1 Tax=Candidatus Mcinerneyibacterium aminivorans TaxID=2703815 RepID=A0A5D0MHL9_9BACT|nr:MAG: hypothetical protein FXF47_07625 [Candidatus Mcinerneyibacterium aminivorans]
MKYHVLTKGFFFALYLFDKFGETFRKSDYYAEKFIAAFPSKYLWFDIDRNFYEYYFDEDRIKDLSETDSLSRRKMEFRWKTLTFLELFGLIESKKVENYEYLYKKSKFFDKYCKLTI